MQRLLPALVLICFGLFWLPGGIATAQPAHAQTAAETADQAKTPEAGAQQPQQTATRDDPGPDLNRQHAATGTLMERRPPNVVEEIIVTGSRIRRDAFTAALPVTIINTESSTLAGLANISEVLQTSALASGAQIDNTYGGAVVSGGPGADLNGTGPPWRRFSRRDGARVVEEGLRDDRNWTEEHLVPERRRIQVYSDGSLDFDPGGVLGTVSAGYDLYGRRVFATFNYNFSSPF